MEIHATISDECGIELILKICSQHEDQTIVIADTIQGIQQTREGQGALTDLFLAPLAKQGINVLKDNDGVFRHTLNGRLQAVIAQLWVRRAQITEVATEPPREGLYHRGLSGAGNAVEEVRPLVWDAMVLVELRRSCR